MRREMQKAQSDLKSFGNNMKSAVKGLTATLGAIGIGFGLKTVVEDAMKVEAAMQQLNRALGSSAAEFSDWAKTSAEAFNLSRSEAIQYGAVFSNLVSTFDSSTSDISAHTKELLKASSVIAAATGRDMGDVLERIRSGMLGNTEAIEDLGVNVNASMLESTEAFKKFANGKSWDQLDFKVKQQIIMFGILEQTTKKYGDTLADNTTSRLGAFTTQLKNVQLSLGQAFLPILNVILPSLTAFATSLAQVMSVVAQFSQALFGKASMDKGIKATDKQADSVGNLGDSYKDAGKAAQGALAGFDEINNLSDSSGGGADAASAGGSTPLLPDPSSMGSALDPISEKVKGIAESIKQMFAAGGTFEPIITSLNNLKLALEPFTETLWAGLQWAWDNILVPFSGWVVAEAIPAFLNAIAGALNFLNPLLVALQPLGDWLWVNFLQPIAAWTGGVVVDTLNQLGTSLTTIGDWIKNNQEAVRGITIAVAAFMAAWEVSGLLLFIQTSGGVAGAIAVMTGALWGNVAAQTSARLAGVAFVSWMVKDLIVSYVTASAQILISTGRWIANTAAVVAAHAAGIAMTIAQEIATVAMMAGSLAMGAWTLATQIGTGAVWLFNAAMAVLELPITLIILAIAALALVIYELIKHWDDVKRVAADCWEGIKKTFGPAVSWLMDNVINPYINLWTGLFNVIIKGANFLVRALNSIKFDVPDWIPVIGGKTFGGFGIPEIPEIPKLARGGIVDGATNMGNYIAGEAGAEMIVPLENTSFVDKVAGALGSAVLTAMQMGSNGNKGNGDINIIMEGVTVARVIAPFLNKENNRVGGSMITAT